MRPSIENSRRLPSRGTNDILCFVPAVKSVAKNSGVAAESQTFSRIAEELIGELRGVPFEEPRKSRKRPTLPLAQLVESILDEHRIGREAPEHTIRAHWPALVGSANAAYSHAVRVERDRKVVVHVAHAVVRNELFMHRAEIVERIQKLPGCAQIKEIHLRAG